MEFLAERYKWSFDDIRKLSADEIQALLKIVKIRNKLEELQAKRK